jgi:hypothetical protein
MKTPQIPADRWINNLLEAAQTIADKQYQESRWLAANAFAWESPDEAINVLYDCVLDGFIEQFSESFSEEQATAVTHFRDEVNRYCKATPQHLEPEMVLTDLRWDDVRQKAAVFIEAFKGKWPTATEQR